MDYVVDSNIIMGMLISGKASYRYLLEYFHFISPEFTFVELEKYKEQIQSKSKLEAPQFRRFTYQVFGRLTILPAFILTEESKSKAKELTVGIDVKDMAFVALALQLDLVLLTNDKLLEKGLKKKGFRKVMLFRDFLKKIKG